MLYYLLNPIVDWMEKHKINRLVAITIVFVLIAFLIIWGLAVAIPSLQHQVMAFVRNVPAYLKQADKFIDDVVTKHISADFKPQIEEYTSNLSSQITDWASNFSSRAVNWAGNLINTTSTGTRCARGPTPSRPPSMTTHSPVAATAPSSRLPWNPRP